MKKTKEAWKAFTEEPYDYNINVNNNIDINANTDTKRNTENTTLERYTNQNKVIFNQNIIFKCKAISQIIYIGLFVCLKANT